MSIKFVTEYPALFITETKTLVIADDQIGLEHELYKGLRIPRNGCNGCMTIYEKNKKQGIKENRNYL